jgi:hypothetical protein
MSTAGVMTGALAAESATLPLHNLMNNAEAALNQLANWITNLPADLQSAPPPAPLPLGAPPNGLWLLFEP